MEEEYIKVKKDLVDKYGFNKAIVVQYFQSSDNVFTGTLKELSDKIYSIPYDAVKHVISELLKCGALEQKKIAPLTYRMELKNTYCIKKRYSRGVSQKPKVFKNERVNRILDNIMRDREKKNNNNL